MQISPILTFRVYSPIKEIKLVAGEKEFYSKNCEKTEDEDLRDYAQCDGQVINDYPSGAPYKFTVELSKKDDGSCTFEELDDFKTSLRGYDLSVDELSGEPACTIEIRNAPSAALNTTTCEITFDLDADQLSDCGMTEDASGDDGVAEIFIIDYPETESSDYADSDAFAAIFKDSHNYNLNGLVYNSKEGHYCGTEYPNHEIYRPYSGDSDCWYSDRMIAPFKGIPEHPEWNKDNNGDFTSQMIASGGVKGILWTVSNKQIKTAFKNQADIIYYSGHGWFGTFGHLCTGTLGGEWDDGSDDTSHDDTPAGKFGPFRSNELGNDVEYIILSACYGAALDIAAKEKHNSGKRWIDSGVDYGIFGYRRNAPKDRDDRRDLTSEVLQKWSGLYSNQDLRTTTSNSYVAWVQANIDQYGDGTDSASLLNAAAIEIVSRSENAVCGRYYFIKNINSAQRCRINEFRYDTSADTVKVGRNCDDTADVNEQNCPDINPGE